MDPELISNTIKFILLATPILNLFYLNIYIVALIYSITFVLFIIYYRISVKPLVINKIVVLYGLLLIALLLPLTIFKIESFWGNYFSFLLSTLIYFIFINLKGNIESKIVNFAKIIAFIFCTQLLTKIFTNISNGIEPGTYKSLIQITSGNSNSLGFFLLILFFILYETSRKKSIFDYFLLIFLIISIVTLQSRSAILAFFIVLIFHAIEKDFRKLITVVIIFFITLFSFQSLYTESKGKITEGYYNKNATSYTSEFEDYPLLEKIDNISSKRLTLYKRVFNEYKKSPLLGVGLGNVYIDFHGKHMSVRTHNIFLDLLTSSGVIGLFLFGAILFYLIKFLWRNKNKSLYVRGVFYGLIAILIQGMLEPNIFTYHIDILLWTLVGASYLIINYQKENGKFTEVLQLQK